MTFIQKILFFFAPSDFSDDPYGWLTNQISHTAASFTIFYSFYHLLNIFTNPSLIKLSIPFFIFWLVWESYHLIKSKDINDFFQDLFFELSGILIFIKPVVFLPILLIGLVFMFLKRI